MTEPSEPINAGPTPTTTLPAVIPGTAPASPSSAPSPAAPRQQLGDLPLEELQTIAEEFGVDARKISEKAELISAIHRRRQMIASLDRAALVDVLHWAGKTPMLGATNEQLAIEIVQVRSMRFTGLSDRGLFALALLRGCEVSKVQSRDDLVMELKSQEGFFSKVKRKTRGWVGKRMQRILGDETTALPAANASPEATNGSTIPPGARQQALKEEIEESGFFGGIANRVKRQADSYVNQKLDEIEARIDRKLDEIDRRLAEWRDKEIANRIRILKITLWVSIVVAVISLIYSYIQVEAKQWRQQPIAPQKISLPKTNLVRPSTMPMRTLAFENFMNTAARPIEIRTSRSSVI